MKNKLSFFPLAALLIGILGSFIMEATLLHASTLHTQSRSVVKTHNAAPTPFMHRPFYGSQTVLQRTTSFFDHDKPWYINDGIFVRYDGTKWTNVAIGSCTGGVNCYDGHNGYDLDLRFEPVLSVAAGTVIRAGWYNPLNHNSSLGLWVAIDHGNGYVTAYGHLSALNAQVGDQVGIQWQVGTSGTTGSSTGPHLHMATYYYPSWSATDPFGWTGNYPDPNVVADNFLWVNNSSTSYTVPLLSANGNRVYPGATLIDDGGAGWNSTGSWNTAASSDDIGGSLHWTATSSGSPTATATWQPELPADGYYEVGAFVDSTYASSSWAPYTVYSADPVHAGTQLSHSVYVDESHIGTFQGPFGSLNTGPQWVSLGTYYFRVATPGHVVLSNATGENGAQIAADGMEFVPVSVQASLPQKSYRFTLTSDGTPGRLLTRSITRVSVTIQNTSNFTWSAGGSAPVEVFYRWLNAQNQVVATGTPVALPQDVIVGTNVTMSVPVQAPGQTGTYTLQWNMIEGSVPFLLQSAQMKNDTTIIYRAGPRSASVHISTHGLSEYDILKRTTPNLVEKGC